MVYMNRSTEKNELIELCDFQFLPILFHSAVLCTPLWCGVMCCTVCTLCQYMTDIILHSITVHAFTSNMISTSTSTLTSNLKKLVWSMYNMRDSMKSNEDLRKSAEILQAFQLLQNLLREISEFSTIFSFFIYLNPTIWTTG